MMTCETNPQTSSPTQAIIAAALGLAASVVYFLTRSASLVDWDSVQFMMALDRYSIASHQPHPPGFPLYIFPAWILKSIGLDPRIALALISAAGGGILVAASYVIFTQRLDAMPSLIAATLLAILPGIWLSSSKALSDSFGTGLLLASVLMFELYSRKNLIPLLVGGSLLGAGAIGVRPQNFWIPALLILILPFRTSGWNQDAAKRIALGFGVFIGGCLLWLPGMLWVESKNSGGESLSHLFAPFTRQWSDQVMRNDQLFATPETELPLVLQRLKSNLAGTLATLFGWRSLLPGTYLLPIVFSMGWLGWLISMPWKAARNRTFWLFHFAWIVPYSLFTIFILPPYSRYFLPIAPFLVLAMVEGWIQLCKRLPSLVPALLLGSITCVQLVNAYPLAHRLSSELAPPEQWLCKLDELNPEETRPSIPIFLDGLLRHAQWRDSGFEIRSAIEPGITEAEALTERKLRYTDDPFFLERHDWDRHELLEITSFERPKSVHEKHTHVTLYIIHPIEE